MANEDDRSPNELETWIESAAGKLIFDTMYGIYMYQHGASRYLKRLYGKDVVDALPNYGYEAVNAVRLLGLGENVDLSVFQPELITQFVAFMSVENIHNAVYFPDTDRLVLSAPNTFFLARSWELEEKIETLPEYRAGNRKYILDMTATIKENGWKIFDNLGIGYAKDDALEHANGLLAQGYIPLAQGFSRYRLLK